MKLEFAFHALGARVLGPMLLVLALLPLAGCNDLQKAMGEDEQRLQDIDDRFNNGDYENAKLGAAKYVQDFPNSYRGWSLLGWVHVKSDELEMAGECFEKSLSINSKWDNAYVGKGTLCRKLGDNDGAREAYRTAIRLEPDNAEAYASLLVIELLDGQDAKAAEYGEKAWSIRQDLPSIPANAAVAYHYLGNFEKRDEFFEHAKRLDYHNLQGIQDIFDGVTSIR